LKSLEALPEGPHSTLFSPYVFFLSRETPRPVFEFMVRSFGGHIGWHESQGAGSIVKEDDDSITHVIIDRPPLAARDGETEQQRLRRLRRKYVQPQWIVDCVNAGKILLEDNYAQGKLLPPHLSPFGEQDGAYNPALLEPVASRDAAEEEEEEEEEAAEAEESTADKQDILLQDIAVDSEDEGADHIRTAELNAELAGVDAHTFDKQLRVAKQKQQNSSKASGRDQGEKDMNKMMMSNKKRKLYEKLKYTQNKKTAERTALESKRKVLDKKAHRKRATD